MNISSFLNSLKIAYPDFISEIVDNKIVLHDGYSFEVRFSEKELYELSSLDSFADIDRINSDVTRIRVHELLQQIYGSTEDEVRANLEEVIWLPSSANKRILINRINGVAEKLQLVSNELDLLPTNLKKYVEKLSGTFNWRKVESSDERSLHSYGIAIDINKKYGSYWLWDLKSLASKKNLIPDQVVRIFEKHGFIWGGRWKSYDTMHFEYRPEFYVERKKRVLVLSRGGPKYGSEMQLLRLIEHIDKSNFELHLITQEDADVTYQVRTRLKLELPAWGKLKNIISRYTYAKKLLAYVQNHRIEVIHCSYQWLYPYAEYVSKKLNVPVVLHMRRPNNKSGHIKHYSSSDRIICISKRIREEFLNNGCDPNRLHLIHDSVDINCHNISSKTELKDRLRLKNELTIGIVGRIYPSKKQDLFIDLANLLSGYYNKLNFVIVGKADNQEFYSKLVKMASLTNANIIFTGHVEDMPSIYNMLDILISFSGGSSMYEAMAVGKIVVSVGFVKRKTSEFLKDRETAFVIEEESIQSARDVIIELLDNNELKNRIQINAQKIIYENLGSEQNAKKVESVYLNCLNNTII